MSKILDFEDGLDTGEATEDSIQPYENGEDAVEEVFNRPPELLRERTEKIRAEAGYRRWVDDVDRGDPVFVLYGGTSTAGITWNGPFGGDDGELVINRTGLRVFPFYSPGAARADFWEGAGSIYPTRFAHLLTDNGTPGEQDIEWVSKKFDFEGGNQISITVTGVAGYGATTVEVNGSNTVADPGVQPSQDDIVVTYDSGASVGVDDIITAINGDSVANQLVDVTYASGNSLPVSDPAYDIPETFLSGGIDTVYHDITAVELDNFFSADSANPLREGDTLAIWYDTPLQRRRSIEENGEAAIPAASLVNLSAEPDKAPNAVIIGRVVDSDFVFSNGVRISSGSTIVSLFSASEQDVNDLEAADTAIREDYERPITTPPAIGSDEGSKRLGVDAAVFTHLSTVSESQQQVNEDIDGELALNDAAITSLQSRADTLEDRATLYTTLYGPPQDTDRAEGDTYIYRGSQENLGDVVTDAAPGTAPQHVDANDVHFVLNDNTDITWYTFEENVGLAGSFVATSLTSAFSVAAGSIADMSMDNDTLGWTKVSPGIITFVDAADGANSRSFDLSAVSEEGELLVVRGNRAASLSNDTGANSVLRILNPATAAEVTSVPVTQNIRIDLDMDGTAVAILVSDGTDIFLRFYTLSGSSLTFQWQVTVGTGAGSDVVEKVHMDGESIYVFGNTDIGPGSDNQVLVIPRQTTSPDTLEFGTINTASADDILVGGVDHEYVYLHVDTDRILIVDKETRQIIHEFGRDAVDGDIVRDKFVSNDRYLIFTEEGQSGSPTHRLRVVTRGYKGGLRVLGTRAPNWASSYRLH